MVVTVSKKFSCFQFSSFCSKKKCCLLPINRFMKKSRCLILSHSHFFSFVSLFLCLQAHVLDIDNYSSTLLYFQILVCHLLPKVYLSNKIRRHNTTWGPLYKLLDLVKVCNQVLRCWKGVRTQWHIDFSYRRLLSYIRFPLVYFGLCII